MLQLFLIKPYTSNDIVTEIPLTTGGIGDIKLTGDLGQPYILDITLNQNLKSYYDIFQNNDNVGVRLREVLADGTINVDLAFAKDRQPQVTRATGRLELSFKSSLALLDITEFRSYPLFTNFTGLTQNIVNQLSSKYIFRVLGVDRNLNNFQTGTLTNTGILAEVLKNAGFSMREKGVDAASGKTIIEYGDLDNVLPTVAIASNLESDYRPGPGFIRIVGEPKINYNGQAITHLLAYGQASSGTGADKNNSLFLTSRQASYIDQGSFPLVSIPDSNGKDVWYVYNAAVASTVDGNRVKDYPVTLSTNTTDEDQPILSNEAAERVIYRQAVNYLMTTGFSYSYTLDYSFDRIYLPGSKVLLNYTSPGFEILNQSVFLKNVEVSLTKLI